MRPLVDRAFRTIVQEDRALPALQLFTAEALGKSTFEELVSKRKKKL